MAKKLEECTQQFTRIKGILTGVYPIIEKAQMADNVCENIILQAATTIRDRVQDLKDGGAQGTTLNDFKNDGEVKTSLKAIDEAIARFAGQVKDAAAVRQSASQAHDHLENLQEELTAEIQQRKSKKIAFFKIESKSLPDLEKLVAEMKKFSESKLANMTSDSTFGNFDSPDDYRDRADNMIAHQLSQTRAEAATGDKDLIKQGLDMRHLTGTSNKVKIGYDTVMKEARNIIEARKSGDATAAGLALQRAAQAFKAIDPLAKQVKTAAENNMIRSALAANKKEGPAIMKLVNAIETWHSDAGGVLKKLT